MPRITRWFALAIAWMAVSMSLRAQAPANSVTTPEEFLYGASVYPELQTPAQWKSMLDEFEQAHINVVRVSESSWGNLETAPGSYDFGWLKQFLDELDKHRMKAILGTSSYIPPQWLAARHPEVLAQLTPGVKVHPMGRKAACLNHPLYRQACHSYIQALGAAFKDHPAVIGWQLDNEIEFLVGRVCYNPACEAAWHDWLKKTYHTPDELNQRLCLVSWGMKVSSFEEIPQPTQVVEGGPRLPALTLAALHFHRDTILDFFREQTRALREAGVKHWVTSDWNALWLALADDPKARQSLDIAGLNFYPPSAEDPSHWSNLAWHEDKQRSAHGLDRFLITETRFGFAGDTATWDAAATRDQFRMWMLQPAAFGASSLIYWSGNRWRGGHWPQWGGLLDWSGKPELDFDWAVELGGIFQRWGKHLLEYPVNASAAVLTDFDQRATLQTYPHTPASNHILGQAFDLFHRLGIGVDSLNGADAANVRNLAKYSLIFLPAATALDGSAVPSTFKEYVEQGGHLIITPFTAYQDWDGIFRSDGFGANLAELSGVLVRTGRRMGSSEDGSSWKDQHVVWKTAPDKRSTVGINGYCEIMEANAGTEILARFQSTEPLLDGRPAATRRKVGKGSVIKLAFWPKDDSLAPWIQTCLPGSNSWLNAALPAGVQAVPRSDNSLFIVNTAGQPASVSLVRKASDRLSGKTFQGTAALKPFEVLWLE